MPQLDQITVSFLSQLIPLLAVLALIYVMAALLLPKVQGTIDARAKRVADDLDAADKAHARADEVEEDYRTSLNEARGEANSLTSDAKSRVAAENEKRLAAADERLNARLAEAEAELNKQREAALAEISDVAADATRQIVERVSSGSVTAAEAQAAVKEAMANG
ncbi:F0F1 ATP synthase subunit B family protein [Parasphingopyxis marina]|uniref:ATP synthase subunit b n=1 Tax=Parasphingopyxis marina TaxID=2761622 RepID=A0A842HVY0_9SPHN|nr:ATPase [Parasphingopyxis marina]MBC2778218.1 ATPase [Parasphingopyxis marina]